MESVRNGTLSDAIEAVSTLDIIEAFDIPNKTRRGRTYILCPGHEDKHFGSCYIDKNDNGYYCYVCGEHVQKWQMVLKLNGNNKTEARDWFFAMSGIAPAKETTDDPYRKVIRLIRKLEDHIANKAIHNDMYSCAKIDSSYGRNINGEYLYSEVAIANPLLDIYKSNKSLFKKVTSNILDTEIKKASTMCAFYDKNLTDCLYIEEIGPVPYEELRNACIAIIDDLKSLIAEVNSL